MIFCQAGIMRDIFSLFLLYLFFFFSKIVCFKIIQEVVEYWCSWFENTTRVCVCIYKDLMKNYSPILLPYWAWTSRPLYIFPSPNAVYEGGHFIFPCPLLVLKSICGCWSDPHFFFFYLTKIICVVEALLELLNPVFLIGDLKYFLLDYLLEIF